MNVGELLIRIGADTGGVTRGVAEARREVASLPEEHVIHIRVENDGISGGGFNGMSRNKNIIQAIVALLPIAAAGIEASVGALGGLVSMLGAATVGASGFAAVAISTLNDVFDAQKNIEKANQDIAKASTEAERKTAVNNLAQAYKGLNGYQLAALGSLQKFKSFWSDFAASFQAPVVVAFSQALDGLRYILENISPAIRATSTAVLGMFQRMKEVSKSEDFKRFFDWLGGSVGGVISTFGSMFMNTMQGVMNLMVAFQPVSDAMQGGFVGMTQAFLQWTQGLKNSESFKQFMSFVIAAGPTFMMFIKQISILFMDLFGALAPLGKTMLDLINVILALFNVMTAFVFSLSSAKSRVNDLANAIRSLFGFQTKAASSSTDTLVDVNKMYQDMFGNVGDVTGGLKDAKKAADGFLASFDEVHNVPDFSNGDSGGGFTPPTMPTMGGTTSGGGAVVDNTEVQTSTNWLQALIDKIKQIPPVIPIKFDPPDAGGGAVATAVDATMNFLRASAAWTASAFQSAALAVQAAWHGMLDYMQSQLNAYSPYLTYGWGLLLLSVGSLVPSAEIVKNAWHTMLDYMQSQLNAYRPYLEYGLALIGLALGGLTDAIASAVASWQRGWQAIGNAVSAATSPILSMIDSVKSAYASLMATLGKPIQIPSIQLPPMPKIEMPSIVNNIQDTLKNFDYGTWFKGAVKDLGEAAFDIGLGATGLKGAQAAGKAAEVGWPAVKAWLESLVSGGGGKAVTGFAGGGVIGTDSIVRVGEQGRKEAIIPLETNAMQPFASAIASSMGSSGDGNGGDIVLQIDGVEFARVVAPYGVKESARIGGNMITTT